MIIKIKPISVFTILARTHCFFNVQSRSYLLVTNHFCMIIHIQVTHVSSGLILSRSDAQSCYTKIKRIKKKKRVADSEIVENLKLTEIYDKVEICKH